jgi:hypothetical protein
MTCEHVAPGASPFVTLFVIEDHLGLASGIVECRECSATCLLELIDIAGERRAYRVATVAPAHAAAMIRTFTRGTCDINRARGELQNLESASPLRPVVLVMAGAEIVAVRPVALADLPRAHWRELPCDGRWLGIQGRVSQ